TKVRSTALVGNQQKLSLEKTNQASAMEDLERELRENPEWKELFHVTRSAGDAKGAFLLEELTMMDRVGVDDDRVGVVLQLKNSRQEQAGDHINSQAGNGETSCTSTSGGSRMTKIPSGGRFTDSRIQEPGNTRTMSGALGATNVDVARLIPALSLPVFFQLVREVLAPLEQRLVAQSHAAGNKVSSRTADTHQAQDMEKVGGRESMTTSSMQHQEELLHDNILAPLHAVFELVKARHLTYLNGECVGDFPATEVGLVSGCGRGQWSEVDNLPSGGENLASDSGIAQRLIRLWNKRDELVVAREKSVDGEQDVG
ncbi:unnamed protein product, partial [Amoebophrya sp. A25]